MSENTTPKARPDVRDPLVVDVHDLGRRPGSMRHWRCVVPAPTAIGLELVGVPSGAPLALDLRLESVHEGVLVTGGIRAPLRGECARCLDAFTGEFVGSICELFAYPNSVTDGTTDQDEVYRLVDDLLDLLPVVRDTVVLELPMTPLCRPDCAGLCPWCGQRLDDLPAGHAHRQLDPRWSALAARADAEHRPGAEHRAEPEKE